MSLYVLLLLACFFNVCAEPDYASVLKNPCIQKIQEDLPPDISFIFADLKFDGKSIKVCEFGPATYAGITETRMCINGVDETVKSPFWNFFWNYIQGFDKPFWRVGGWEKGARPMLTLSGGYYIKDMLTLIKDPFFKQCLHGAEKRIIKIADAKGIIVFTGGEKSDKILKKCIKQNPGLMQINRHVHAIVSHKNKTNLLFSDPELAEYKPKFKICQKQYTPNLAANIIKELEAAFYVIKPFSSLGGVGVIMVAAHDLDETLHNMLDKSYKSNNPAFTYWKRDKKDSFIIEAYAPSKNIIVSEQPYDPTMRLVCFLSHDQGGIMMHVIGGYWKTPIKHLLEEGTLNEKHITAPHKGLRIALSHDDFQDAKVLFAQMMLKAYPRMLKSSLTS